MEPLATMRELKEALPDGDCMPRVGPTVVVIDLETTGLIKGSKMPHITQIGAVEFQTGVKFHSYVLPKCQIEPRAQEITGIEVANDGSMKVHGIPVEALSISCAFDQLIAWLSKYQKVVLVAHNGKRFDFRILVSAMYSVKAFDRFYACVEGLIDSLDVFKEEYPNRRSYSQENLMKDILKENYNAHDAIGDVQALIKLLQHTSFTKEELLRFKFPLSE